MSINDEINEYLELSEEERNKIDRENQKRMEEYRKSKSETDFAFDDFFNDSIHNVV